MHDVEHFLIISHRAIFSLYVAAHTCQHRRARFEIARPAQNVSTSNNALQMTLPITRTLADAKTYTPAGVCSENLTLSSRAPSQRPRPRFGRGQFSEHALAASQYTDGRSLPTCQTPLAALSPARALALHRPTAGCSKQDTCRDDHGAAPPSLTDTQTQTFRILAVKQTSRRSGRAGPATPQSNKKQQRTRGAHEVAFAVVQGVAKCARPLEPPRNIWVVVAETALQREQQALEQHNSGWEVTGGAVAFDDCVRDVRHLLQRWLGFVRCVGKLQLGQPACARNRSAAWRCRSAARRCPMITSFRGT